MSRPLSLVLLALLAGASEANAQVSATPLTLGAALAEARTANPALAQSRAAMDRASANAQAARSAAFPRLTFAESVQRGTGPVFAFGSLLAARRFTAADFAVDRLNRPGSVSAFGTRADISQLLFDGGRTAARIGEARSRRDVTAAELDLTDASVAMEVVRAFTRLMSAEASMSAAAASVDAADGDLLRATRRRDAGTATDADVLAMTVHRAEADARRVTAMGEIAIARAELNRLLGAPIDRQIVLVEPAVPAAPGAADAAPPIDTRPEVRLAAAAAEAARLQARAARGVYWPTVVVRTGYETVGLRFSERAGAWSAAAEVGWSLSLGGGEAAQVRAASAAVIAAKAAEADARARAQVDIASARARLSSARARLTIAGEALTAAREQARIVRNRYDAGLAPIADVLRASAAEFDAAGARTRAIADAIVADADLRRATGQSIGGGL